MSIGQSDIIIMGDEYEQIEGAPQGARLYADQDADAHGIDQSDYSKIEAGKRYYTYEQCRRIALALNTSMDYLAGLTDEKKPYPRPRQNND